MVWNIPNTLTLTRLCLVPVFFYLYLTDLKGIAAGVLTFAMLTDYFDGHLARKLKQATHIGSILDPITDRIFSMSFYSYLILENKIPLWFGLIVFIRNFSQLMCIPILVWWLNRSFKVKPKLFPRIATTISDIFLFIPLFLVQPQSGIFELGLWVFYVVIAYMETVILVTYLPRLYQIAVGTHDTFE